MHLDQNEAARVSACSAQRGFSIVSAIFLLVVLSALGAFMVTFSSVQHVTSAQDLQGARAYQAARAGIDWGAYRVLRNSSCATNTPLTPGGSLAGFGITVECKPYGPYKEGDGTVNINIYHITSTARQGTPGSASYVERQLQATIGK